MILLKAYANIKNKEIPVGFIKYDEGTNSGMMTIYLFGNKIKLSLKQAIQQQNQQIKIESEDF